MRTRRLIAITVMSGVLLAASSWAAADASPVAADVATTGKRVCVNAEIDGVRALSYDCLSQQLAPVAVPAAGGTANAAEGLVTAPSNRVGTFNASAESNRFGTNWGKSVNPQRPPPLQVVPLR